MRESTERERDTNGEERAQTELPGVCFCFCSGFVSSTEQFSGCSLMPVASSWQQRARHAYRIHFATSLKLGFFPYINIPTR
jgi:hypothetical protein